MNSRDKGARGERLFAALCHHYGYDAVRRTAQYCGKTGDAADCVGLPGIHIEVKFVEHLNYRKAMEQSIRDSKGNGLPIVASKTSRKEWLITMRADDWFKMYNEWRKKNG